MTADSHLRYRKPWRALPIYEVYDRASGDLLGEVQRREGGRWWIVRWLILDEGYETRREAAASEWPAP